MFFDTPVTKLVQKKYKIFAYVDAFHHFTMLRHITEMRIFFKMSGQMLQYTGNKSHFTVNLQLFTHTKHTKGLSLSAALLLLTEVEV